MAAVYIAAIAAYSALGNYKAVGKPRAEVDGAKLFARECADCHGEDGRGQMLKQPDFTDREWHKRVSDEQMFKSIKWGKEPMPFYAGALTDDEISALVKYIRSLPGKDAARGNRVEAVAARQATDNCAACHQKNRDPVPALFARSVHASAGKTCNSCHKGNAEAADKTKAHEAPFIGKPTTTELLAMCGSCHRAQLAAFKTSRHFPDSKGAARVDCVQCHGAHTVGAASPNFSFAYFCSGCHGLEYLPELPAGLQKMLVSLDDVRDAQHKFTQSGGVLSDEIMSRRKELRRIIGEIVHQTDSHGAVEKLPRIVELGEWLKQALAQERK